MMSDRCAICDADNELRTLCEMHYWLSTIRHHVQCGTISDWPPLATGKYPAVVMHRDMLLTPAFRPLPWQATVLATLTSMGVVWDDGQPWQESYGDWLSVNGYLGNNPGSSGKAA